ncbi:MAG TPA: hypothetical protein VHC19_02125 [Pirellulales bacterium]|nr:hypothetical protein [Pirellulales bacterium]
MRILTFVLAAAILVWQGALAAAQDVGNVSPAPAASSQNSAGPVMLKAGAKTGPGSAADANAATDGFLARQRYQSGHWWYWGPNAAPAAPRQAIEPPDNDDARPFGQQNNNYFGAPAISRYSTGFGAHWNPYRGFDYGYQSRFGQNYYGYGNGYRGYGNGFYGYGYGVFSNGAYATGD